MIARVFLIVLVWMIQGNANAARHSDLVSSISSAEQYYLQGDYAGALDEWKGLIRSGVADPDILFNMGNASSMLGQSASAMLYYEMALRYRPGSKYIREAIAQERAEMDNPVTVVNPFFLGHLWSKFLAVLRPAYWVTFGLVVLLFGILNWLFRMHAFKRFHLRMAGDYRIYFLSGILLIGIGIFSYKNIYRNNEAIVMEDCELMQGPSDQSPLLRALSPGEKVRLTDEVAGWYKVYLLNYDEGWIPEGCIRLIDLHAIHEY